MRGRKEDLARYKYDLKKGSKNRGGITVLVSRWKSAATIEKENKLPDSW